MTEIQINRGDAVTEVKIFVRGIAVWHDFYGPGDAEYKMTDEEIRKRLADKLMQAIKIS